MTNTEHLRVEIESNADEFAAHMRAARDAVRGAREVYFDGDKNHVGAIEEFYE